MGSNSNSNRRPSTPASREVLAAMRAHIATLPVRPRVRHHSKTHVRPRKTQYKSPRHETATPGKGRHPRLPTHPIRVDFPHHGTVTEATIDPQFWRNNPSAWAQYKADYDNKWPGVFLAWAQHQGRKVLEEEARAAIDATRAANKRRREREARHLHRDAAAALRNLRAGSTLTGMKRQRRG